MIIRWIINTAALWAITFIPGIRYEGSIPMLFVAALVLGLLNALVRPILLVLTLPLTIVTLGLFVIVLNAAMLWLMAWFIDPFQIDGCIPAILGALGLSIISMLTGWIGKKERE